MRRVTILTTVIGILGCTHCASSNSGKLMEERLAVMEDQVVRQRAQHQELNQQVDDLRRQVALLTDRLEAHVQRQDPGNRPNLRIIKLMPESSMLAGDFSDEFLADEVVEQPPKPAPKPTKKNIKKRAKKSKIETKTNQDVDSPVKKESSKKVVPPLQEPPKKVAAQGSVADVEPKEPIAKRPEASLEKQTLAKPEKLVEKQLKVQPEKQPEKQYEMAYATYEEGNLLRAQKEFARFIKEFPEHDFADNAYYWMGEVFYDKRRYKKALGIFHQLISKYPQGNKAPDALLKIGYCYLELGDKKRARQAFEDLLDNYPGSRLTPLAEKKLKRLKR